MSEIKKEWIEFAKQLRQEEENSLIISIEQYEWFGKTMEMIKENSNHPTPSGTECRRYPRALFSIIKGGKEFVKDFLVRWSTQSYKEWAYSNLLGEDAIYDLIGYGVQPLFGDNYLENGLKL